ncbi:MAG: prepilin-type N-terminal cleavage/methylation domain-containing protein [bacterium]|nr:prepilin-type N-terminal cleavage/methylation domain-containing protein [bacterium]
MKFIWTFIRRKREKGLSIIELLIAISIIAILATGGGISYARLYERTIIDSEASRVVGELRNVVAMARANEDGASWGIKFVKAEGEDYYQVLKTDEENVYRTVYLNPKVMFGNLYDPDNPGVAVDVFSEMFIGGPAIHILSGEGVIELTVDGREDLVDTITISKIGLVFRESSYSQKADGEESQCSPGDRVTICHTSSNGWQTITVDAEAVDTHIEHGDYCGVCNP